MNARSSPRPPALLALIGGNEDRLTPGTVLRELIAACLETHAAAAPLQVVVLSRVPFVFATRHLAVSLVMAYCFAIQFVWLNFAAHAEYWLPYQFYPLFS